MNDLFLTLSTFTDDETRKQITDSLSLDNWPFPVSCGIVLPVRNTKTLRKSKAEKLDEQGFREDIPF